MEIDRSGVDVLMTEPQRDAPAEPHASNSQAGRCEPLVDVSVDLSRFERVAARRRAKLNKNVNDMAPRTAGLANSSDIGSAFPLAISCSNFLRYLYRRSDV